MTYILKHKVNIQTAFSPVYPNLNKMTQFEKNLKIIILFLP